MLGNLIIIVCGLLGFGIVWALMGAREADKKIRQSEQIDDETNEPGQG